LAAPTGGNRGTGCATDRTANDSTTAPANGLAQNGSSGSAHATTQNGSHVVGMGLRDQCE
jgi:hypothetical protein